MRKGKSKAVVKLIIGIFLGTMQLSSQNHAIVRPVNAQAIGYDIWGVCLYVLCLWLIISGLLFFFQANQIQT